MASGAMVVCVCATTATTATIRLYTSVVGNTSPIQGRLDWSAAAADNDDDEYNRCCLAAAVHQSFENDGLARWDGLDGMGWDGMSVDSLCRCSSAAADGCRDKLRLSPGDQCCEDR